VTDATLTISLEQDRYHRQSLMPWWDQARVAAAKILVVGAGALGNEILKNLALTGAGHIIVFDPDTVEKSNLSRAVLFRDSDEGRPKVEAAAGRARELNPDVRIVTHPDNILSGAGLGLFLWADVIIGAVDNREARVFINAAAAKVGRAWVDGAIEALAGVVRVFDPARGACYECTMNATDRQLLAERRSCALLARDIVARGHVPTTAVGASIVGALQVQEALKLLHGQPAIVGEGLHFQGMWGEVSRVAYTRRPDCPGHDTLPAPVGLGVGVAGITLEALLARAEGELGDGVSLDLSRDCVVSLTCPTCDVRTPVGAALGTIREAQGRCPTCKTHRVVEVVGSISRDAGVDLSLTPAQLGLPPRDIVLARQGMGIDRQVAWLFDGDPL
jgi:molybdopterin/thiamine biosynthesis adenylyltransferase